VERVRGSLPLFDPAPLATPPSDLREVSLCALSGAIAGAACPVRTREWLPTAQAAHECQWHHASDRGVVTVWPAEYREWARAAQVATGDAADMAQMAKWQEVPGSHPSGPGTLTVTSPTTGATYLIDPTLKPEFQSLPLRARGAIGRVEWSVNATPVGISLGDAALAWPLARGAHTIVARDGNGRTASSRIIVK